MHVIGRGEVLRDYVLLYGVRRGKASFKTSVKRHSSPVLGVEAGGEPDQRKGLCTAVLPSTTAVLILWLHIKQHSMLILV